MTLGTHIVVAGAAGALFAGNPIMAFFLGIASHFAVDAIPHWDWPIKSIQSTGEKATEGKMGGGFSAILRDFSFAGLDVLWGVVVLSIAASFFNISIFSFWFVAVVAGGVLPDALQLLYFMFKREPLTTIQRFHGWIHTDRKIAVERYIVGPLAQLPVVLIALIIFAILV